MHSSFPSHQPAPQPAKAYKKVNRNISSRFASFQTWESDHSDSFEPQELQLDLELTQGPRALQELVLHVHSCPKLPKTAKQLVQMSNFASCLRVQVIVLESLSTEPTTLYRSI